MAQMIFTNNFTARQYSFDRPPVNPVSKTFKKGDRAGISEQTDFGGNKHLVAISKVNGRDISFDVTNAPLTPYVQGRPVNDGSGLGNKSDAKSFFTPKNIIIGVLAIGVIIGGLKLAKVF